MASWARDVARSLLAGALPRRWAHVQGVAKKAEHVAASLALSDEALVAAAWLHDVGYAPGVTDTGFHPLDGACYLADLSAPGRVVNLVARHSYAILEAEFRGFGPRLAAFPDRSLSNPMRHQAAWFFCDVTFVSMAAGGWLIQTLEGRGGGAGGRRNRLGLAA